MTEPLVRVVVERAERMTCPLQAGDAFEVCGSELRTPGGRPFCAQAMAAALPVVGLRQSARPADDWLERKPFVCCPDATENVIMRLDRDEAGTWSRASPEPLSERQRIRCTVESMQYSACGLEVGDYFEVDAAGVAIPDGKGFCWFAIAAVLPMLRGRVGDDVDAWLASRPLVACPDPPEALHMRIEVIEPSEGRPMNR